MESVKFIVVFIWTIKLTLASISCRLLHTAHSIKLVDLKPSFCIVSPINLFGHLNFKNKFISFH